ncbi:Splicing factor, arginine/serine-rich [Echinococcus granulosus]|uniref:Splicing factor, arginine/serine-rich n=1 Tax=Echinococcus granulosus TaxID=6210 RepID=W6UD01_ECHGR|nr:Splicing factor, arginine/serine-rich [Echinococcus granulosus]EUB59190.1 Splicing factor, arginine/serine-rich [Echinococcus granulosus]
MAKIAQTLLDPLTHELKNAMDVKDVPIQPKRQRIRGFVIGASLRNSLSIASPVMRPQFYLRTTTADLTCGLQGSRRSRMDSFSGRDGTLPRASPSHVTLYRTHSVRRIAPLEVVCAPPPPPPPPPPDHATTICCQTNNPVETGIYLSSPFILKDVRHRYRSPLKSCHSPSNRNVRFCSPGGRQQQRIRAASSCSSERGVIYPSRGSRGSSLVRVYSRSNSPVCETILTSSLPSKAAGTVSVACECNLPPACLPKPRISCRCDVHFPPPPPPPSAPSPKLVNCGSCCNTTGVVDRCTNTGPDCQVVECCQISLREPPSSPKPGAINCESQTCVPSSQSPKYERYEATSCLVERITTRKRTVPRSFSCVRAPDPSYYLRLMGRKENDLWNRISECEMDLAAFECMMCSDVVTYIKDAIDKSRHLIDCEFRRIRHLCNSDVFNCCHADNGFRRGSKSIEELWHEAQLKLSERPVFGFPESIAVVMRADRKIYIGNLPPEVRTKDLDSIFSKYGRIADIDLKRRRGPPFAFIEYEDERDAEDAVRDCDGYKLEGYALRVEFPRGGSYSSFRRGGGRGSGPSRRSDYRVIVTNLPPSGSWQDLKDHMREAGDVGFADVFKDGSGVVEFLRYEDMKYALKKLDDSKFRSHEGETSYIRVREERQYSRSRSRSRSYSSPRDRGRYSNSRSASRSSSERR